MSRIIIFGFPHCGTSILKSIIGHIQDVDEIINETSIISSCKPGAKFTVCKFPFTRNEFFTDKYKNYIKIFIIRNPLYVFSSLNKRYHNKIPNNHSIREYVKTVEKFIDCDKSVCNNLYTIKYEDLFDNNYEKLRQLLDSIGLVYDDTIFDNSKYRNEIIKSLKLPAVKPENENHQLYRTWQINQPFVCNNIPSKIDLTDAQKKELCTNKTISKLYPNLGEDH